MTFVGSGLNAVSAADDTYTRVLAPGLLEMFPDQACPYRFQSYAAATAVNLRASVMNVLAQVAIKDAAKCDTHCELQISVNQWPFERIV